MAHAMYVRPDEELIIIPLVEEPKLEIIVKKPELKKKPKKRRLKKLAKVTKNMKYNAKYHQEKICIDKLRKTQNYSNHTIY